MVDSVLTVCLTKRGNPKSWIDHTSLVGVFKTVLECAAAARTAQPRNNRTETEGRVRDIKVEDRRYPTSADAVRVPDKEVRFKPGGLPCSPRTCR